MFQIDRFRLSRTPACRLDANGEFEVGGLFTRTETWQDHFSTHFHLPDERSSSMQERSR